MYHRKRRRSHRRCSVRNVVFRTFQKSQENTYARVSLLIHAATLLKNKKETLAQLFRVSFMKFLRTLFFHFFQSTASRSREDRTVVFLPAVSFFFFFSEGSLLFYWQNIFPQNRSSRLEAFCKKGVLSTSQNSSENTCVGVFSLSNVAAQRPVTLLKRDSGSGVLL